jgi:hypothetical protein
MVWNQVPTFKRDQGGRIMVNPERQFVKPFILPSDAPNQVMTIPAGGRFGPVSFTARWDGPIEIFAILATVSDENGIANFLQDYNIRVFIESPGKRKNLMNRPIHLIGMAGQAGIPSILSESVFLPNPQSINLTAFNDDANIRNVEISLACIKFYPNRAPEQIRKSLYGYASLRTRTYAYWMTTENDVTLTAGSTANNFITVPDDADMEIYKLTAHDTNVTAGQSFRTRIREMSTDSAMTGDRIIAPNLWGGHQATPIGGGIGGSGGLFPNRLPTTMLVRRSTQLQFETLEVGGGNHTIQYICHGRKVENAI